MFRFLLQLSALTIGVNYVLATPNCQAMQQSQLANLNERMNQMISALYSSPFLQSFAKSKSSGPSPPTSGNDYSAVSPYEYGSSSPTYSAPPSSPYYGQQPMSPYPPPIETVQPTEYTYPSGYSASRSALAPPAYDSYYQQQQGPQQYQPSSYPSPGQSLTSNYEYNYYQPPEPSSPVPSRNYQPPPNSRPCLANPSSGYQASYAPNSEYAPSTSVAPAYPQPSSYQASKPYSYPSSYPSSYPAPTPSYSTSVTSYSSPATLGYGTPTEFSMSPYYG